MGAPGLMVSQARWRSDSLPRDPSRSRTAPMNARNDMLERLRGRREGFTLPQPFYIDPAYFRLDMEMIWYRDWLFVGHDCELTPGSFMTVADRRLFGDPGPRSQRDDPRVSQHLSASRQSDLRGREGRGRAARLPLSPMELRSRRAPPVRAPGRRGFRQVGLWAQSRRLRERRWISVRLPCRDAARFLLRSAR